MQNQLIALGNIIERWVGTKTAFDTPIGGLSLYRGFEESEPSSCMFEPSVCIVAQGAKKVLLGEDRYQYDSEHFLLSSMFVPAFVQIVDAGPTHPYLGLVLRLDLFEVSQMITETEIPPARSKSSDRGMAIGEMTGSLLDAFQRLAGLLDEPDDVPTLAPMIKREITYRLLRSDQGDRLRQIVSAGSQSRQIAQAIDWLKENYRKPLAVDDLALAVNMSTSRFHHHFRSMTALSPLQFQKQLRLQEARRLMLSERLDAANAAFEVGYESPSQFSREYSRLFGLPPVRDISDLRKRWTPDEVPIP